ncbi:unnamed protein product [Jaminaea pallidilutea]
MHLSDNSDMEPEDIDYAIDDDSDAFDDVSDMADEEGAEDADFEPAFTAEDDDAFTQDVGTSKTGNKAWEVEYVCRTLADLQQQQGKEIDHVASMFVVKDTDAAILLRHYGWNKERLIERYMDDPDAVKVQAGVIDDPTRPKLQKSRDFTCSVCYTSTEDEDSGVLETLALGCGHRFCKDCYQAYVEQKVREEGESRRVQCMQEKCKLVLDEKTVKLLVPPATYERYKSLLDRTYVDDSRVLCWCPAPNCENAIECNVPSKKLKSVVPSVQCLCGHQFCFGCGYAAHDPSVCPLVRLWMKKCKDDSETANWISANTKECPKCSSTIEKNGGCNHMTCRKCRYEWCWMCGGPWSEHGNSWYNCNRYDEKSGTDARDAQAKSRAYLERYLHYFNRYANHEQSARLDRDLFSRTEKKMEKMQRTSDLTWIEVQFLKKAVETLTECRMTLKWTYCMAYYLKRNNMTELFEDNQRDLERATEALSEQLEADIEPETIPTLRQKVTDLTVYVQRRREIMLTDTAQGYEEGRWDFNVDM